MIDGHRSNAINYKLYNVALDILGRLRVVKHQMDVHYLDSFTIIFRKSWRSKVDLNRRSQPNNCLNCPPTRRMSVKSVLSL